MRSAAQDTAPQTDAVGSPPDVSPNTQGQPLERRSEIRSDRAAGQHPLVPALQIAEASYEHISSRIKDYSATLVRRERVGRTLGEHETIFTKIRHEQLRDGRIVVPFSVYLYFGSPESVKGREVIYVAGRNDGRLLAQESPMTLTGLLLKTVALDPKGGIAMRGNRYPITEVGIQNLTRRLIEVAREEIQYGPCQVTFLQGAKVGGRACRGIRVEHPVRRDRLRFHLARIFWDEELNVPIRYEAYDWPEKHGDQPQLLEEYTYLDLKLNLGLTDADFDPANPQYHFK